MSDTTIILGAFGALFWLLLVGRFSRQAAWVLLLWIPIQGWVQLNLFNDSSATVLLYELHVLALYAVFGFRALRSPGEFKPPPIWIYAVPFAAWTFLLVPSSIAQNGPMLTLLGLRTHLLTIPLIWIGYRAFTHRRQIESVSLLLMLQLVIVAAVAVSQFTGFSSASGLIFEIPVGYGVAGLGIIRPPGTFSSPGHLGMYVLFAIPFALGLLGLRVAQWKRAAFVVGLAGATVALVVNTQRATMVLLLVTVPLIVLFARRMRAARNMAIAFVIMIATGLASYQVVGAAFRERLASITLDMNNTVVVNPMERLNDALLTAWTGGGLGIASPGAARLEPQPMRGQTGLPVRPTIKPAESFMAALVYETGVPGLVLFYALIAAVMFGGLQAVRACRSTDMALFAAAILAFEAAILLQSWPYDPLHYPPSRILFWFWAGVLLRLPRLALPAAMPVIHPPLAVPGPMAPRRFGSLPGSLPPQPVAAGRHPAPPARVPSGRLRRV